VRKREKYSFGWIEARKQFETSDIYIRQLATKLGVDEKTVRRRARSEAWTRNAAQMPQQRPGAAFQITVAAQQPDSTPAAHEMPHPTEIARETCGTLNALRAHLDTVVQNLHIIRELADAETAGDESPARARLVEKVLSLPGLIKAANDLTSAIARLADLGPGKKAGAMDLAKAADTGLFATPPAPSETLQ
jgi:DNA primase